MRTANERVPVRTIATVIGMLLATALLLWLIIQVRRVIVWFIVALFFALLLSPIVSMAERRLRLRRGVATFLVFLMAVAAIAGILFILVKPVATQGGAFVSQVPKQVDLAAHGRGPVGEILKKVHADKYVAAHQTQVKDFEKRLTKPALSAVKGVLNTVAAVVTIFVLCYLMVLEAPVFITAWLNALPDDRRARVHRVGSDCGKTVTGYMTGNLLISVVAGVVTFVPLLLLRVPYAGLLAVFVGITDLIPLVGATIGAIVVVLAAFIHSTVAGITMIAVFLIYQQLENHLLQPVIMSRTVKLNPLTVLVSVLIGVELAGILGALLAIPVAGVIAVIARDLYDTRRGELKSQPTVGEDEIPADSRAASEAVG